MDQKRAYEDSSRVSRAAKLLIVTQAVDLDNPVLGFFHRWIEELAIHYESIVVICLFEGRHSLPKNVEVFSLGKEKREAYKAQYTERFLALVWGLRERYDSVFVHMNQEYVLVAGWFWKLFGKRVYLWRNHYQPHTLTGVAAFFCTKMFCTSEYSYITKYPKTRLMPLGIDTDLYRQKEVQRTESVLSIGRIAPSKHLEIIIDAIKILADRGIEVKVYIYGDALPEDRDYEAGLRQRVKESHLEHLIEFHPGILSIEAPTIFSSHEMFVNCSRSGMYDKTIFEAASCGTLPVASSEDYAKIADPYLIFDGTAENLAVKIKDIIELGVAEKENLREKGKKLAEMNSIHILAERLAAELL